MSMALKRPSGDELLTSPCNVSIFRNSTYNKLGHEYRAFRLGRSVVSPITHTVPIIREHFQYVIPDGKTE